MPKDYGDVAVFWDYENCSVPTNTSGCDVVKGIQHIAQKYGSVKSFRAYLELPARPCPPESKLFQLRSELHSSGVSLIDCPHNGRKDVADKMILVDMMAYAIDHPAPLTYILISGDRDFAYATSILKSRRYHVVLLAPSSTHSSLRSQATSCFNWNSILQRAVYQGWDDPAEGLTYNDAMENSPLKSPCQYNIPHLPQHDLHSRNNQEEEAVDLNTYLMQRRSPNASRLGSHTAGNRTHLDPSSPTISERRVFRGGDGPEAVSMTETHPIGMGGGSIYHQSLNTSGSEGTTLYAAEEPRTPARFSGHSQSDTPRTPIQARESQIWPATPSTQGGDSLHSSPSKSWLPPLSSSSYPIVPPHFIPLVDFMRKQHDVAKIPYPLRSNVALELNKQGGIIYKQAGVERFGPYIALAERAKIVQLGGREGNAWIALRPEWRGTDVGRDR